MLRDISFRVLEGRCVDGHDAGTWSDSGPHADPFSRLYYIDGGRGTVEYAGRTYRLSVGRYYLFPAHYPILHRSSPGLVQYYVHFTAHVPGALSLFDVTEWDCEMAVSDRSAARQAMLRMMDEPKTPADVLRVQVALQGTIAGFLKGLADERPHGMGRLRRFRTVVEYIHQHLQDGVSVGEMAQIASLHPNYFSNLFSETFGVSPREYVMQKRIERAQLLLWRTDDPIKQIADAVGVEGAPYFCRIFKKRVGMTPREYRRQRVR